jgi:hypothetical protein
MPNFIADRVAPNTPKELPVRFSETHSLSRAVAVDNVCKHLNRISHHENLPAPESNLLDDPMEPQVRSWEHLWIDIGGEG